MPSANERLLDSSIAHAHAIESFKNSEVRRIMAMLNRDTYPALVEELQKRLSRITSQGFDRGVETTKRLRDMIAALEKIIESGMGKAEGALTDKLHKFSAVEAKGAVKRLEQALEIDWEVTIPSPSTLRALVTAKPFDGHLLADHFEKLTSSTQDNMRRALNIGLTSGESFDQIAARVSGKSGVLDISRRHVRTIVGTAVQHVGTQARAATYQENDDIIKGEKFVATLDSSTCPRCQALDGTVFPLGEGPQPPLHLGPCRCIRSPITKSWKELGLNAEDTPKSVRSSLDGYVPEDTTYSQWLARQSSTRQDAALGPARAELYRSGKAGFDSFTDDAGRLLTLDELRASLGID